MPFINWHALELNSLKVLRSKGYFPCSWFDHNATLKWARDHCERSGLADKEFNLGEVVQVPKFLKPEGGGPMYFFARGESRNEWHPFHMISNLRDEDLQLVIPGPERRAAAVVRVQCVTTQDYDHNRHHAQAKGHAAWHLDSSRCMKTWAFVITRNDPAGTQCWLQPSRGQDKMQYGEFDDASITPTFVPPKAGPGKADLKGHFEHFKLARSQQTLRFENKKNQQTAFAA